MALFNRLSDLIQANVHALLDKAEDPNKMVAQLVREIDDAVADARAVAAKLISEKKHLQRQIEQAQARAENWSTDAEKALKHEREDLARAALSAKQKELAAMESLQKDLPQLDSQLQQLDEDMVALSAKAEQARARQRQLEQRHAVADSRQQIRTNLQQNLAEVSARYERFEAKVEAIEAQVEAYDLGKSTDLKQQINALQHQASVDAELEALRKRVNKA